MSSYILTEAGARKVRHRFCEICQSPKPSIEEMGRCADLDSDTIRKLLNRTGGVKRKTLERLCNSVIWDLEEDLQEGSDYTLGEQRTSVQHKLSQTPHLPPDPILGKLLRMRYEIKEVLGSGGYGRTYLACDCDRPNHPLCVVKRLSSQSSEKRLRLEREAQVLCKLGDRDQIPSLLGYFEEDEYFYLIYQFIQGHTLSQELIPGEPWSEDRVIVLLQDILQILAFVHQNQVIHRDIHPGNLIRRDSDGKIVLINFGAVKEISQAKVRSFVATKDYIPPPPEQNNGTPKLSSDIYAVGLIGIQAITGLHPRKLDADYETGNILWRDKAEVSLALANILDKMVRYDFKYRYSSAIKTLQAFQDFGI